MPIDLSSRDILPARTLPEFREVPDDLRARFDALPPAPISMTLTPQEWLLIPEMAKQAMDSRINLAKLAFAVGGQDQQGIARQLAEMEQRTIDVAATLNAFTIALMSAALRGAEGEAGDNAGSADR